MSSQTHLQSDSSLTPECPSRVRTHVQAALLISLHQLGQGMADPGPQWTPIFLSCLEKP